jgi:hypothetical protein
MSLVSGALGASLRPHTGQLSSSIHGGLSFSVQALKQTRWIPLLRSLSPLKFPVGFQQRRWQSQ